MASSKFGEYTTQELKCLLARHKDYYNECKANLVQTEFVVKALTKEIKARITTEGE